MLCIDWPVALTGANAQFLLYLPLLPFNLKPWNPKDGGQVFGQTSHYVATPDPQRRNESVIFPLEEKEYTDIYVDSCINEVPG